MLVASRRFQTRLAPGTLLLLVISFWPQVGNSELAILWHVSHCQSLVLPGRIDRLPMTRNKHGYCSQHPDQQTGKYLSYFGTLKDLRLLVTTWDLLWITTQETFCVTCFLDRYLEFNYGTHIFATHDIVGHWYLRSSANQDIIIRHFFFSNNEK